jgi:hypothetical protein
MESFWNKTRRPAKDNRVRDIVIFTSVLDTGSYEDACGWTKLTSSRIHQIMRHVATDLLRQERLINPNLPHQYEFPISDLLQDKILWLQRLAVYKQHLKRKPL